jgi:tetratricopeptide (TPR) repeat protein
MLSWRQVVKRLILASLGRERPELLPEGSGRAEIVRRFHARRREAQPPVFVIQGPLGSGKTHLVGRIRATYRRSSLGSFPRRNVDVRLDLMPPKVPEAEFTLEVLRRQLRTRFSLWRRVTTPRFDLMRAQLFVHRVSLGEADPPRAVAADLQWALQTGVKVATSLHAGGTPLVVPSLKAGPGRWARQARVRFGWGAAAKWVKAFRDALPTTDPLGQTDLARAEAMERGLTIAMAQDLAAATRRKRFAVRQVVIFIDAYDRVENESSSPAWLVEFADDLRDAGAAVMLVLACRRQRLWTERMHRDGDYEDKRVFEASSTVEVHPLHPLGFVERTYVLADYQVPGSLIEPLANASAGHPLALRLLGMTFGNLPPAAADRRERLLLPHLPKVTRPTDDWVRRFCALVGPLLVSDLRPEVARHAHAAAALRAFDRPLMVCVLGDEFRGDAFTELLATPLVEAPKPSGLGGNQESYRMRTFARQLLRDDDAATEARLEWHARASQYFDELAQKSDFDPERQFALRVEALYHRSYVETQRPGETPKVVEANVAEAFMAEQTIRRFDHCEMLLDCAADMHWLPDDWKARVLALAGRMYLTADRYEVAEERLRESLRVTEDLDQAGELVLGTRQSLVKCLRLQGRIEEALVEQQATLDATVETTPVAAFQAVWSQSLLAKAAGDLIGAIEKADSAGRQLSELLGDDAEMHVRLAERLGFGSLPRKRAHLLRHQADLARRSGDFVRSHELLDAAARAYATDPEPVAQQHLRLLTGHVLRAEGLFADAEQLAAQVLDEVLGATVPNVRLQLVALRAVAQARLASPFPEGARAYLLALSQDEACTYPSGRMIGYWGLGELARLAGQAPEATAQYQAALRSNGDSPAFERFYVHVGLAETERHASAQRALDRLRRVADSEAASAHPSIMFWSHLVAARAYNQDGDATRAARQREAARHALDGVRCHKRAQPWELDILASDEAAVAGDQPFPSVALLLP